MVARILGIAFIVIAAILFISWLWKLSTLPTNDACRAIQAIDSTYVCPTVSATPAWAALAFAISGLLILLIPSGNDNQSR